MRCAIVFFSFGIDVLYIKTKTTSETSQGPLLWCRFENDKVYEKVELFHVYKEPKELNFLQTQRKWNQRKFSLNNDSVPGIIGISVVVSLEGDQSITMAHLTRQKFIKISLNGYRQYVQSSENIFCYKAPITHSRRIYSKTVYNLYDNSRAILII